MTSVRAVLLAIAAALLYAVSTPVSKLLLGRISPTMLAGLLYLGAGAGLMFLKAAITGKDEEGESLARDDMKFVVAMIVLDIAAPVLLLLGLGRTTAANVSLLNNFEIVMTSVIAFALFGERIPADVWCTGPGFRRLRTQYLVLYPCPAAHRRGADERVLCAFAVHRRDPFADRLGRTADAALLDRPGDHGLGNSSRQTRLVELRKTIL